MSHVIFDRHAIETMQSVCLTESGLNVSDSLKEETNLMGLTFGGYLRSKVILIFSIWKNKCNNLLHFLHLTQS